MSYLIDPELLALRQRLHAEPELSGHERHSAELLAATLARYQPDALWRDIGGHGLLALFDSGKPGPSVLLRADMDALPITEQSGRAYCSQHAGVAHLCGHDGHSAILMGVAAKLAHQRPSGGRVYLLWQPAEETGAGAQAVLADPAFVCQPDWVYALHNLPGYPLGEVVVRTGAFSASVRSLILCLQGKPAHAAEPEHGCNPALAMAELLQLAARLSCNEPEDPAFALVTPVYAHLGEKAYGTSAGYGEVHFTLRTFSQAGMVALEQALLTVLGQLAQHYGLAIRHHWLEEFQASENDAAAVALLVEEATACGLPVVERPVPFKWGEDFGLFTQRFRGALFGMGAGEQHPALHNADYDFPDALLQPASTLLYRLALRATLHD